MSEFLFFIIFSIPAIYGLAELIHILRGYILKPRETASKYIILYLNDNLPYEQLISVFDEFSWYGKKYAQNIIAVDCGIPKEECGICKEYCENKNLIFCDLKELSNCLDKMIYKT